MVTFEGYWHLVDMMSIKHTQKILSLWVGISYQQSSSLAEIWKPSTQGFVFKTKNRTKQKTTHTQNKKKTSNTKSWLSIKYEGTDWNQLSKGNSFTSRKKEDPTLAGMSFATEGSSKEWAWLLTCKGTGRVTSRIIKIKVSCTTLDILNCQNLWEWDPGAEVFKLFPVEKRHTPKWETLL